MTLSISCFIISGFRVVNDMIKEFSSILLKNFCGFSEVWGESCIQLVFSTIGLQTVCWTIDLRCHLFFHINPYCILELPLFHWFYCQLIHRYHTVLILESLTFTLIAVGPICGWIRRNCFFILFCHIELQLSVKSLWKHSKN